MICNDTANKSNLISDLAPWVTILLSIILWFLNQMIERRHEKFKRRLDYRIKTLGEALELIDFLISVSKSKNTPPIDEIKTKAFMLRRSIEQFGNDEEYTLFEEFGNALFVENSVKKANEKLNAMRILFTNNIRRDLNLKERKFYKH